MSECKATWWRACKFKPRYEQKIQEALAQQALKVRGCTVNEMFGVDVYIRDVCERCGKTIERVT
jgi:cbb3-type cytochrome oxidase cytochrome c subunit